MSVPVGLGGTSVPEGGGGGASPRFSLPPSDLGGGGTSVPVGLGGGGASVPLGTGGGLSSRFSLSLPPSDLGGGGISVLVGRGGGAEMSDGAEKRSSGDQASCHEAAHNSGNLHDGGCKELIDWEVICWFD
ncbi:unnamed protein product [Penicillium salamii]|nr:unnamed protein product [Penicillium salamii]CAG8000849.1 unnamed protein product [Penicillium salamii]CAG8283674.1 unnamed protein product [Penicillium salamii]